MNEHIPSPGPSESGQVDVELSLTQTTCQHRSTWVVKSLQISLGIDVIVNPLAVAVVFASSISRK